MEIEQICRKKFGCREGSTEPRIHKFIAKARETGFLVDAPRREFV